MSHIIVTDEQAALISRSNGMIQVQDCQGRVIGYVTPAPTAEEIAKLKARLSVPQPTYTTAQVLEHLRSLDQQ